MKAFCLLVLAAFALPAEGVCAKSVQYTPTRVVLQGTIERQTFPGRPNYESIVLGDEIEKGWFLRLAGPIEVKTTRETEDPNAETERNVRIVQLTWGGDSLGSLIQVGSFVELKGELFHRWNGHHHARVLLDVSEAKTVRAVR